MMIRTERNIDHTKEESRDQCSVFVVTRIYLPDAFSRCSQIVIFLFDLKLKTDKEKKWDRNQKLKN